MGIYIRGILTVVPTRVRTTSGFAEQFGQEETERIAAMTGVREVRIVAPGQTAADLGEAAASRLLARLNVAPRDVQGIVFVTQTPDYVLPATACILQNRLGLGKQSLAFDVNLGCSAYPYGLAIVASLLSAGLAKRVLLITADTVSRLAHPCEKATTPLFGDAAVATLLESDEEDNDLLGVELGTDGGGWKNLIQPIGQQRFRTTGEFAAARPESLANIERPEYISMNGTEIFTFTLREVPGIVQRTLVAAGLENQDVDYFFFHQANKFILDHLIRKMRLPPEKCLLSIERFGNTSGPSPAVTACVAAAQINRDRSLVAMFVGFGVGYSWGGVLARLRPGTLWPLEEMV